MAERGVRLDGPDHARLTLTEAGIDSLLLLEWAVTLEERTGRPLSDDLLESLRTVGDLEHYYERLSEP